MYNGVQTDHGVDHVNKISGLYDKDRRYDMLCHWS